MSKESSSPEVLMKTDYEGIVVDLIEEFIEEEYLAFPVGIHDDMLDSLSRLSRCKFRMSLVAMQLIIISYIKVDDE